MMLNVRTTFNCNLDCSYCLNKEFRARYKKFSHSVIPVHCISQIIKEHDIDAITFCGHGETVLAQNFKELFLEATKHVKKIKLISNGSGRKIEWWNILLDEIPDGIEYDILLSLHLSQNNADSIKNIIELMKEKNKARKYNLIPTVLCPLSIKDVDRFLEIKENDPDFFYHISVIPNVFEKELHPKLFCLIKYEIKPGQFCCGVHYDLKNGICEEDLNTVNIDIGKDGKLHIFRINHNYTYTNIENDFAPLS